MGTPGADSPFWQTIIAGLGLSGVTITAAWRFGRAPFKRLNKAEQAIGELEARQLQMLEDNTVDRESIRRLHDEHTRLREILAAQPTKEDLHRSETRTMERVAVSESNVNGNINRLFDLMHGRTHNGH